jgi:hypothetical protein
MMVPKTISITILLLFSHGSAFTQAGASTFEAASVKPAAPPTAGFRVIMGENPGRVNYSNVSLKDIISLPVDRLECRLKHMPQFRRSIPANHPSN